MPSPSFLSDGNTPNRNDPDSIVLQKILGALNDMLLGGGVMTAVSMKIGSAGTLSGGTANILALDNGTSAQGVQIYNTTSAGGANYERATFDWIQVANEFILGTQNGGTGTARTMSFMTGNSRRWQITSSGHFIAATDNTFDIGATGATRPRNLFIGGGITHGSATLLTTTTALTNGAAANTGTLTNAPAVGNPTKWVPINDNGTTRYIPAW
jgi:hypothetical protein